MANRSVNTCRFIFTALRLVMGAREDSLSVDRIKAPLPFYLFLTFLVHIWIAYYHPMENDPCAIPSFFLQHLAIFSLALFLDARFPGKLRFIMAGSLLTYTIYMHMSALLLSITGVNATEAWIISTRSVTWEDFVFMVTEAGFSLISFLGIMLILTNIFVIGGVIRHFLVTASLPRRYYMTVILLVFLLSTGFSVAEQAWSHRYPEYFNRRTLPCYIELFRHNRFSHTIPLRKEMSEQRIRELLSRMGQPRRKVNIVYIVLESFRFDMIDKKICPNLYAFSRDSLSFPKAYCDAIHTSYSWNLLLLDRPIYSYSRDLDESGGPQAGSIIMRILKKAGYSTHLIASANFKWNGYYRRITGDGKMLDTHYLTYDELPGRQRNELDNATAAKAVEFIKSRKKAGPPFALFIQLDSSHFTYFFDKDAELYNDYPRTVGFKDIKQKAKISYLFNRYKNSARHVDNKIGMILSSLKTNGLYENTAIVIISDHGEGFAPGKIGHHVFYNEIMKLLLAIRLPGVPAGPLDRIVSQYDIMPGLIDYLSIPGYDPSLLRGTSFLGMDRSPRPLLTMQGTGFLSLLNFFEAGILCRTEIEKDSITVTPYGMIDKDCGTIDIMNNLDRYPWKQMAEKAVRYQPLP